MDSEIRKIGVICYKRTVQYPLENKRRFHLFLIRSLEYDLLNTFKKHIIRFKNRDADCGSFSGKLSTKQDKLNDLLENIASFKTSKLDHCLALDLNISESSLSIFLNMIDKKIDNYDSLVELINMFDYGN